MPNDVAPSSIFVEYAVISARCITMHEVSGSEADEVDPMIKDLGRGVAAPISGEVSNDTRSAKQEYPSAIEQLLTDALASYGVRLLDNIDLSKISRAEARARIVGEALMERGDARAFVMGRKLVAAASRV